MCPPDAKESEIQRLRDLAAFKSQNLPSESCLINGRYLSVKEVKRDV